MGVAVPPKPPRPHPVITDPGTPRAGVFSYADDEFGAPARRVQLLGYPSRR
jgi:hypothetical protein